MRNNPVYGPFGIILAAFPWESVMKLMERNPCVDTAKLGRTILALMFSGNNFVFNLKR